MGDVCFGLVVSKDLKAVVVTIPVLVEAQKFKNSPGTARVYMSAVARETMHRTAFDLTNML